ncbi:BUD22-domain-containing protein [Phlyctochytrium arcticum]|nr:BUD22-domain-containing protein [Phlyctochytrium arcticum]
MKKAKTFETRKLVKKLRLFRAKSEEAEKDSTIPEDVKEQRKRMVTRLEADIEAMKVVDLDKVACNTFATTLQKSDLPHQSHLIDIWRSAKDWNEGETPSPALLRVEQRLSSSQTLVATVTEMEEDLKVLLTGQSDKRGVKRKKNPATQQLAAVREQAKEKAAKVEKQAAARAEASSKFLTSLGADSDMSGSDDEGGLSYGDLDRAGGEWSGSEEAQSDYEEEKVVKKNRQGQRQRRAEAEKKYGQNAKHVAAELKAQREKQKQRPQVADRSKDTPLAKPPINTAAPPSTADKRPALHPSWQAKRQQSAGIGSFTGTKINFGNDDEGKEGPASTMNRKQRRLAERKANGIEEVQSPNPKTPFISQSDRRPAKKQQPEEKLHPSWEAKRKAKEAHAHIMSDAKPKKIVFSNDSDED